MDSLMILGASGFVGRSVLKAALRNGATKVYALEHHRPVSLAPDDNHRVIRISGSMSDCKLPVPPPGDLVHAARHASPNGFAGRLFRSIQSARSNKRIIRLFTEAGVRIRYISGSLMYGNNAEAVITESHPLRPVSFARQYRRSEAPFHRATSNQHPLVQIIRIPWVFGNGSWFQRFYLSPMQTQHFVPLYGTGDNQMTLLDADDLGRCLIALRYAPFVPIVNLFMPDYLTQKQFSGLLSQYSGLPVKKISTGTLERNYGSAVREAFNTNIRLGSNYHFRNVENARVFSSVEKMIACRLPGFLQHT